MQKKTTEKTGVIDFRILWAHGYIVAEKLGIYFTGAAIAINNVRYLVVNTPCGATPLRRGINCSPSAQAA